MRVGAAVPEVPDAQGGRQNSQEQMNLKGLKGKARGFRDSGVKGTESRLGKWSKKTSKCEAAARKFIPLICTKALLHFRMFSMKAGTKSKFVGPECIKKKCPHSVGLEIGEMRSWQQEA